MEKLKINLENCYGIKKLKHTFDFTNKKTYAIYAPNGSMKTSFAKTFLDLSNNEETKDLMFPERKTLREINYEADIELLSENIFVIKSYDSGYSSNKVSTLLANSELRKKHELIMVEIENLKTNFLIELKKTANTRKNIETGLHTAFNKEKFIDVVKEIKKILSQKIDYDFSKFDYDLVFNDKVIRFLETSDFKSKIKEYIELYGNLLENSRFFKKGFNHYKANKIGKELKKENFFDAEHYLNLYNANDKTRTEIKDLNEFNEIIKKEQEEILNNDDLKSKFNDIDSKIKNQELEKLREFLKENQEIIVELADLDTFSKKIWVSYILTKKDLFNKLHNQYIDAEKELLEILSDAKKEQEAWKEVITDFNRRFFVPFEIKIGNQEDLILNNEITPIFEYRFKDNIKKISTSKSELLEVLSEGELRALYLLNIIFEIKARQKNNHKTLFVVDDIADSFDYKNKYAIIQYLKEISEEDNFSMIILTHNFDFYRIIQSRFFGFSNIKNCLIVSKNESEIILDSIEKKGLINPFKNWKQKLKEDNKCLISLIPFVRNIIEYTAGINDLNYLKLTSLLHIKTDTETIKIKDLEKIYNEILKYDPKINLDNSEDLVINLIFKIAKEIKQDIEENNNVELECKLILAIAIRLHAEKYIWSQITNNSIINGNQTYELIKRYKNEFSDKKENIKLLEQVNLMTPENIHLNSFMYEPILDMGSDELKNLYLEISALN